MPNIQDHALQIGGQRLAERAFDALDSLILTQLVYMPFEGFLDRGESHTVRECWAFLRDYVEPEKLDRFQQKRYRLTEVCAGLPRYQDWRMHDYVNHIDREKNIQFCAACYDLDDGAVCISFRGTDLTIAGWVEDMNMSFMVVPAQEEAARYVAEIASRSEAPLELAGHSKGGNLSVYAAAFAGGQAQRRIRAVYSFDGPGMYEPQLYAEGYQAVRERIHSYIPQSSVVGMLMYYHPVYTVVEADSVGILQHDAMTWQVRNGHFVCLEGLDMTGRITDEALHNWMAGLDSEARKTFVEVLYTVLEAARIELVTDFTDDWRERALKMLEALKEIDPETRRSVRLTLQSLFSAGASEVIKAVLPRAAQRGARLVEKLSNLGEGPESLQLVRPSVVLLPQIRAYRQEMLEAGSDMAGCSGLEKEEDTVRWLERVRRLNRPETCPEGLVPSDVYLALRLKDRKVVGMIDLRHSIDHPVLAAWGGHIGYSVRPSERGKGYAGEMLRQILPRARQLGMARVLVTCDEDNPASEKVILKNGGVLDGVYEHDGVKTRRYWIALEGSEQNA